MQGSPVVLRVGPDGIVRRDGGRRPPAEMVAAALDGIDDPVVLLGERPVRVDDLLRSLIAQTLGGRCAEVLVVHPADWPVPRVARVLNAVRASADRVASTTDGEPVIETVSVPGRPRTRLRPNTIAVIASAALVVVSAALLPDHLPPEVPSAAVVTSTVAEGRVAVDVPQGWTVERLTQGPGSPRVRVASAADPDQALHITQSYAPGGTLADAAAVLGRVAAVQPAFTGFRGDDEVAGRAAVTYREARPGRIIRWVVLFDGNTRIGIGCQSRPGAEDGVRLVCEQAIRSARELGGTPARG